MKDYESYSEGMNKMNEIMDEILPFKVFKDFHFQTKKYGESHLSTLVCRFKTKELAEDFIDYQETIHPEIKYVLEAVTDPKKTITKEDEKSQDIPKKEAERKSRMMGKAR